MGKATDRKYIRNFAKTLMGQLNVDVPRGDVGINNYKCDTISAHIRSELVERVFQDLRHLKTETIARLAACGIMGTEGEQNTDPAYERLQSGLDPCTMCFVHGDENWIEKKKAEGPAAIIRYMAATAVVAAMYDIVVQERKWLHKITS